MEPHNIFTNNNNYSNRKRNKNIKNIPQFNNKGFFNTLNPTLQQKRYELLFNSKNLDELVTNDKLAGKSVNENKVDDYKFYMKKVEEYSQKQIEWILKNKKQIGKFFNYSSFDKKMKNRAFFNSFTNYLFFPYYKIGNKNQKWFNEFYDFISSIPSIYTFDRRKLNGVVETMRFTDTDEGKLLVESGENQNPSWSFGSDKWSLWAPNVLFNGKSYSNLYFLWEMNDVIFDTGFRERVGDGIDGDKESKECEIFIRKNAKPIIGGEIFQYTFKDFQEQFPFLEDNFRLNPKLDTNNGFGTFDVFMKSYPRTTIEKYGYTTENNDGGLAYLPKTPSLYFRGECKWNKSYVGFFTEMKKTCEDLLSKTPQQSSWNKRLKTLIEQYQNKIDNWSLELENTEEMLELSLSNKYQLKYSKSKSKLSRFKGKTYPYYEYENGKIYEGTASIVK